MTTQVYRYRVKSLNGLLNQQARAVNCVWNFCNDTLKDGSCFSWDRRGNGFLHTVVEAADVPVRTPEHGVGIDLGLKDLATLSTGEKIEHPRFFRKLEPKLTKAQMAKSVHDASWNSFKQMLAYKSVANGAWDEEVNEASSSQVCSCCGAISASSPKGRAGLRIRRWTCSACGCEHDHDVNAAKNILNQSGARSGHRAPAEGIPCL